MTTRDRYHIDGLRPKFDFGLEDHELDELRAELAKAFARPAARARAAPLVRDRFGQKDLDAADPAGHVAWLCVARCVEFGHNLECDAPPNEDAPTAARELRQALDVLGKYMGHDLPDNARLREKVDEIDAALCAGECSRAEDLVSALWTRSTGPTTASHFADLAAELAALLATSLPKRAAERHAAWLVKRVFGDGKAFADERERLDARIARATAELDNLEKKEERAMKILRKNRQPTEAEVARLNVELRELLTDPTFRSRVDDGSLDAELRAMRQELTDLKEQRVAWRRWVPPTEGAIRKNRQRRGPSTP